MHRTIFCQITTNMAEKYIFKRVRAMPKRKKASFGRHIQKNQQLRQYRGNQGHVVLKRCLSCVSWALGEHLQGQIGRHLNRCDLQMQNLLLVGTTSTTPPAPGTKRSRPCPSWNSLVALTGTNGEPVDLFWPPDAEFLLIVTLHPQHQTGTKRSRPCVP